METYYFTFGQQHIHPKTGEPLRDYWIEIVAKSEDVARDLMVEMFDRKWSHQYHEKEFMRVVRHFPKGCYEHYEVD
jgi:hypothetical protein